MEKTISALKARQNLGQILDDAFYRGDHYIVERAGKSMAAVVPIALYRQWKERREHFFAMVDEAREKNAAVAPDELEADVAEAIRATRADKQESTD